MSKTYLKSDHFNGGGSGRADGRCAAQRLLPFGTECTAMVLGVKVRQEPSSVSLCPPEAPPPTRGLSLRAARHTTERPLAPTAEPRRRRDVTRLSREGASEQITIE